MIKNPNILDQDVSNVKSPWQTHVYPPTVSASISKRKKVKCAKSTVFYGIPITFLLQYWYPGASYLRCLYFPQLVVHPTLKQIAIIVGPTVLPDEKKSPPSFSLSTTFTFKPFYMRKCNSMLCYDTNNHICATVILVWTRK